MSTTTLWRPVGPEELALLELSGWTRWPPRLPEQPIFYPVLNRDYAIRIARDWNVKHSGAGYVTEFDVVTDYVDRFEVHQVGGQTILKYWIPAEGLDEFGVESGEQPLAVRTILMCAVLVAPVSRSMCGSDCAASGDSRRRCGEDVETGLAAPSQGQMRPPWPHRTKETQHDEVPAS